MILFIGNYGKLILEQFQLLRQKPEHKLSSMDTMITFDCKYTGRYGIRIRYSFPDEYTSRENEYGMWGIGVNQFNRQYPRFDIKNFKAIEFYVKGANGGEIFEVWIANEYDQDIG